MKLADYVINALGERGIDKIFMVYGSAMGDLCDAFTRTNKTQYVSILHEQAGGFMAEGWAKITGKPGAIVATSGPGGMNLVTPIGNCFYDSVPCIFLTGQITQRFLRPDPSIRQVGFQETDIVSIVKPITKYAKMVTDPKDIRYELEKALYLAQEGRPGPVLLDLPMDVQKAEIEPDELIGFDERVASALKRPWSEIYQDVDAVYEALVKSERPAMMIGGGVRTARAIDMARDVASKFGIPCFPTWNALDVITSDFPLYGGRIGTYGGAGRNFGIQNCDLLIAVGTRISGRITGGNVESFARGAKKFVVDVDAALLQRKLQQLPFEKNILADAYQFLWALLQKPPLESLKMDWIRKVANWRDKYDPVRPEFFQQDKIHPYAFVRTLSQKMGPRDVLVADCGGNIVVANHAFETKYGQRYFTNNGNSPMGFSMCGAMGAWFADPSRQVVCIIGDGGMNMNIQELATISRTGAKIKIFILNNHSYGITVAYQKTNFQGRTEACTPDKGYEPPDFVDVARAYEITSCRIRLTDSVASTIEDALAYDSPLVCDVDIGDFSTYEPRISGWRTPIEDAEPRLPRDEFRANMVIEPLPGWDKDEYE